MTEPFVVPEPSAEERLLASLAKAYPYLVKHASHIDGEFSNALAELRRMLIPPERREPEDYKPVGNHRITPNQTERDPDKCGRRHNSLLGAYVCVRPLGHTGNCDMVARESLTPPALTPAERDFLRALAQAYYDAEAGRIVLKHSDVFLAARRVVAE